MTRRPVYYFFLAVLAVPLFLSAEKAQAEMSFNELAYLYDTGDDEMRELLESVIDGNSNGVSWANSYLDEFRGSSTQIYCPPDEFATDGPGMLQMMREATAANPEYGDLPYGATVMFAYIHKFPCP